MKSILYFVRKEFIQVKRDPRMLNLLLLAPVLQLILFGSAANLDVDRVKTIVFDMDKSVTSRNFVRQFTSTGYFDIYKYTDNYYQVTQSIDEGKVILGIIIPSDFEKNINRRETAKVQAIFDGSDGNTASISAGYVQGIVAEYSEDILVEFFNSSGIKANTIASINAKTRVWYNPTLESKNFMVPGIVGLILTLITLMLTSLAVVKEREVGTMEQLIVTPLKPYQMIIGKLVPFMILGFVAVIFVLIGMRYIFDIEVRGSIPFLFFSAFLYILSTLGLGIFVSTISKTQQQAMMISIFAVMMPMIYLSGFAFPIENMPVIIQYISHLIPLKYFITIIRGVILKGTGFSELWPNAVMLLGMGITILLLSSLRFKKRLE